MSRSAAQTPTAELAFLAAGNIHFAPCAMALRLRGASSENTARLSDESTASLLRRCRDAISADTPRLQSAAGPVALSLAGEMARLAVEFQRAVGLDVSGWWESAEIAGSAAFVCADVSTGEAAAALALHAVSGSTDARGADLTRQLVDAAKPLLRPRVRALAFPTRLQCAARCLSPRSGRGENGACFGRTSPRPPTMWPPRSPPVRILQRGFCAIRALRHRVTPSFPTLLPLVVWRTRSDIRLWSSRCPQTMDAVFRLASEMLNSFAPHSRGPRNMGRCWSRSRSQAITTACLSCTDVVSR